MPKTRNRKPRPIQISMTISTVCKLYRLHPQTLLTYERRGLIGRDVVLLEDGREAVTYQERDLRRIRTICSLTRDLGVNLAGIEVILDLLDRLEERL
ncbi:MAG: MerR family transcriptional regulator [Nitrospirae bacterium]|nr:MerR family transcriptional regulator [Nitrospirota bacterium]